MPLRFARARFLAAARPPTTDSRFDNCALRNPLPPSLPPSRANVRQGPLFRGKFADDSGKLSRRRGGGAEKGGGGGSLSRRASVPSLSRILVAASRRRPRVLREGPRKGLREGLRKVVKRKRTVLSYSGLASVHNPEKRFLFKASYKITVLIARV